MSYTLKTVSMLMKCLTIDIPVYRVVEGVSLRIPRVVLFQKSLLELWADLRAGIYTTKISKIEIDDAYKLAYKEKSEYNPT